MAVKISGAEWKRFYDDTTFWPEEAWHDDLEFSVNGRNEEDFDLDQVKDTDTILLEAGVVMLPGNEDDPLSLVSYFRKWRKQQSIATIVVEVPRENLEQMISLITVSGGKVLK